VSGGSGDDTLVASQGPDVLVGNAGADVFRYDALPWSAGHITDFTVGTDHLDLSAIIQASGYTGTDPVADGRMRFEADGNGGTKVYFDHDAPNSGDWPFLITTLDHVPTQGLTWAQLSSGSAPPPDDGGGGTGTGGGDGGGGTTAGQVLTSDQYGDTLTGGAGNDTLNAGQGPDQLTGNGGDDLFVWNDLPWRAGHVTDFTPGADKLDLRALFVASGYSGSDPVADHHLEFRDDGAGGTAVYFDRDDPNGGDWPFLITTLDHVAPTQIGAGDWLFQ
jgi:Ca2+-binding RTX toxin-like protein